LIKGIKDNSLKLSVITKFERLLELEYLWNQLLERSATNEIFLTFQWVTNWWRVFGNKYRKLLILLAYRNGELIGIAPLMVTQLKIPLVKVREVSFIAEGDYHDFIIVDAVEDCINLFARFLSENRNIWDILRLEQMPKVSPNLEYLIRALHINGIAAKRESGAICPYIKFHAGMQTYDEGVNKKLLQDIRRCRRRLAEIGNFKIIICTAENAEQALERFFENHIKRWENSLTPSKFVKETYRKFYQIIAKSTIEKDWLHFSLLVCNGDPIAYHYGFLYGNKFYYYTPTFSSEFARYSPGNILLDELVQLAFAKKISQFDFLAGDEGYKLRWTREYSENLSVIAFTNCKGVLLHKLINNPRRRKILRKLGRVISSKLYN